ncbi:rho GDP-dissociation inhibitor 1-like [Aulostomus maculatus]
MSLNSTTVYGSCKTVSSGLMDDLDISVDHEDETDIGFKPPSKKSVSEILQLDQNDESLVKYKQTLLGSGATTADHSGTNVQVLSLTLLCDEAEGPVSMDLMVDKVTYMVGSYPPRAEELEFLFPLEEAPSGLMARGQYQIQSKFTDDDKNIHLAWTWNLDIKKDWDN